MIAVPLDKGYIVDVKLLSGTYLPDSITAISVGGLTMLVHIDDDFDLARIADSGQCFRFNKCADGYSVVALDKYLFVKEIGGGDYEFECSEADFQGFWKNYFDLELSYKGIRAMADREDDEYLYYAAEFGKGIRILRQDPWEMLISFIISQRKNIPAIKASIEKICALAGERIATDPEGKDVYSFPTPKALSEVSIADLSACSLGYRDKYVYQAAQDVASGAVDLDKWAELDDDKLLEQLLTLFGVGVKVANCEILFGYHRLNAFPIDVWIKKVLDEHYGNGFNFEKYAPYNGVMQQYLFFYSRSTER